MESHCGTIISGQRINFLPLKLSNLINLNWEYVYWYFEQRILVKCTQYVCYKLTMSLKCFNCITKLFKMSKILKKK